MELNTNCCEKEMIKLGVVDMMNNNINSVERFVCGECGLHIDIINYALDDEELEQEINDYDELKGTKIAKEILDAEKQMELMTK